MNELTNCPICQKNADVDFDLKTYKVRYCRECDFRWISTPYDSSIIKEQAYYWGREFFSANEEYFRRIWKKEINFIKTLIQPERRELIDIGSSYGYLISEANKAGFSAAGVEASKEIAETAGKRESLNVINATVEEAVLEKNKYDVITMMDVVEHLFDPACAIEKISQSAAKNSIIIIEVPYENSLMRKIAYAFFRLSGGKINRFVRSAFNEHAGGHRLGFSLKALKLLLTKYGWQVFKTKKTMMPFKFYFADLMLGMNKPAGLIETLFGVPVYFISILLGMHNRIKVYARKD